MTWFLQQSVREKNPEKTYKLRDLKEHKSISMWDLDSDSNKPENSTEM